MNRKQSVRVRVPWWMAFTGLVPLVLLLIAAGVQAAELRTTTHQKKSLVRQVNHKEVVARRERRQQLIEEEIRRHEEPLSPEFVPCENCGAPGCQLECQLWCGRWVRMEYLLWWRKGRELPPLVTTDPGGGILPAGQVLFGNEEVGRDVEPGARISGGYWIDDMEMRGMGIRFFAMDNANVRFDVDSSTVPVIARPFFDEGAGAENALVVAQPTLRDGTLTAISESRVIGGDAFYRVMVAGRPESRLDFIAGYQAARIDENLSVFSTSTLTDPAGPDPVGTQISVFDSIDVRNEYHAGLVGLIWQYDSCGWKIESMAKVAFGNMQHTVQIGGVTTTITPPPAPTIVSTGTGLLAQATNSGTFLQDSFTISPEFNLQATYRLNHWVDLSMGYSFIYWDRMMQPGGQIDIASGSQSPILGTVRPTVPLAISDYWLHGISLGVLSRF